MGPCGLLPSESAGCYPAHRRHRHLRVSFLIVLVNAAFWETAKSLMDRESLPIGTICAAAAAVVLTLSYGSWRLSEFPLDDKGDGGYRIGILQGNIAQEIKWSSRPESIPFRLTSALLETL